MILGSIQVFICLTLKNSIMESNLRSGLGVLLLSMEARVDMLCSDIISNLELGNSQGVNDNQIRLLQLELIVRELQDLLEL